MKIPNVKQSVLVLAAAVVACSVNAQGDDIQVHFSEEKSPELEEIIVTGQFQQSLANRIPITPEELPFTLSILGRDFLDARNFTRPIEALTTLPNIFRTEDRQGTGTTNFLSRGFEAPILVDNRVQNNFRGAGARDDSFVERYEVLKGPASIVSGPVGAGGVINTITKLPAKDRFVDLKLRTDQFGTAVGEFDVNVGELNRSDIALIRVSGAYRDFKFDADETERKNTAVRPVVIFNIDSSTSIRASVARTEYELNPNAGFPLLGNAGIPDEIDTDTFTGFANGEGEIEDTLYEAELHHEFLDGFKLTIRGSRQSTDFDYQNTSGLYHYNESFELGPIGGEFDYGIYSDGFRAETESESNFYDVQLAYQASFWEQDQDFVAGVAYNKSSFERLFSDSYAFGPFVLDEISASRYGYDDYGAVSLFTTADSKLNSVFFESVLRPNHWLSVIAGMRYDDLEQLTTRRSTLSEYDDSEVTIRLGATAEVSENVNFYASFAQAFVPQFGVKRDDRAAEAETSDGIEIGSKGSVLDGLVSYQVGAFYTERENVEFSDPSNEVNEFFVVTAGEVHVRGIEFSSAFNPVDALNFTLNFGYTDVDVTESGESDEVTEPVFPELTGSFYLAYELHSGVFQGLNAGGGFRYIGEREGPKVDWDSYVIFDLNFSYPVKDGIDLSFDILNVTDKKYVENTSSNTVNTLGGGAVLGAPRTAVLTLHWNVL